MELMVPGRDGGMSRGARVTGFAGENSTGDYRILFSYRGNAPAKLLARMAKGVSAFGDGVNNPVVFEKDHKSSVVPACNGGFAHGGLS